MEYGREMYGLQTADENRRMEQQNQWNKEAAAQSQDEPLGTLAGRGVTTGRQKGGHIRIKVTEPCYIMCICSVTPRIDYSQGNTWDTTLKTMDDLHKPALDGIGYQDYRDWETDRKSTRLNSSHRSLSRMPSSA